MNAANEQGGSEVVDRSILRRIKKLLDRADRHDRHRTPEETAIAATEAARLMAKYRIDRAMVEAATGNRQSEPIGIETVFVLPTKTIPGWLHKLARPVAECNHCKPFFSYEIAVVGGRNKRVRCVKAIGRATDQQAIKFMLEFLSHEIERLASAALASRACPCGERAVDAAGDCSNCGRNRESPRTYGANFRIGAAETIGGRFRERARASERGEMGEAGDKVCPPTAAVTQALVLVRRDRAEVDLYYRDVSEKLGLRGISHRTSRYSNEGREAGREAGKRIHLGPRLGSVCATPRALGGR